MQLVAQAYSPEGSDMVVGVEINRLEYSDTPEQPLGLNREWMQEALDLLDKHMKETGWQPLPRGTHWYSNRYRRPMGATSSRLEQPTVPSDRVESADLCDIVCKRASFGLPYETLCWVALSRFDEREIAKSPPFSLPRSADHNHSAYQKSVRDFEAQLERLGWEIIEGIDGKFYGKRRVDEKRNLSTISEHVPAQRMGKSFWRGKPVPLESKKK
jgi:hypothetical protein